jgi:hypothetical protein
MGTIFRRRRYAQRNPGPARRRLCRPPATLRDGARGAWRARDAGWDDPGGVEPLRPGCAPYSRQRAEADRRRRRCRRASETALLRSPPASPSTTPRSIPSTSSSPRPPATFHHCAGSSEARTARYSLENASPARAPTQWALYTDLPSWFPRRNATVTRLA